MKTEIIKKLAVDGKVDVTLLEQINAIQRDLSILHRRGDLEQCRHKDATDALDSELRAIQARCGHWSKTYFPDPAGGSSSFTECDICGVEL